MKVEIGREILYIYNITIDKYMIICHISKNHQISGVPWQSSKHLNAYKEEGLKKLAHRTGNPETGRGL